MERSRPNSFDYFKFASRHRRHLFRPFHLLPPTLVLRRARLLPRRPYLKRRAPFSLVNTAPDRLNTSASAASVRHLKKPRCFTSCSSCTSLDLISVWKDFTTWRFYWASFVRLLAFFFSLHLPLSISIIPFTLIARRRTSPHPRHARARCRASRYSLKTS